MSALRNRVSRLEQRTAPGEADPVRCILLVEPFPKRPAIGYLNGEITVRRMDGESDADLVARIEALSGSGISLWGEIA